MFCKNCGNPVDTRFCPYCGTENTDWENTEQESVTIDMPSSNFIDPSADLFDIPSAFYEEMPPGLRR